MIGDSNFMKNSIENIFMDMKSYELIQNTIALDELISLIQNKVNTMDTHPITINEISFEVEYRPNKLNLSFLYTVNGYHSVDPCNNKFKNNLYLYNCEAAMSYGDDFCGEEVLLYTTKKTLLVIPYNESSLSRMDCSTGELIQIL